MSATTTPLPPPLPRAKKPTDNIFGMIGVLFAFGGWLTGGLLCPIGFVFSMIGLAFEPKKLAKLGAVVGGIGSVVGFAFLMFVVIPATSHAGRTDESDIGNTSMVAIEKPLLVNVNADEPGRPVWWVDCVVVNNSTARLGSLEVDCFIEGTSINAYLGKATFNFPKPLGPGERASRVFAIPDNEFNTRKLGPSNNETFINVIPTKALGPGGTVWAD